MTLTTDRLCLRPWQESDAESLYSYAKDERIGPKAGWPPHTSVENSREIIRTVLSIPENYAVCLKDTDKAIGCVGLMIGARSNIGLPDTEAEIGYWIGVPFWGQGLIPEAVKEVIRHAFADLQLETLWCGYFDGNEQSKRVQEKCGFRFHHTNENIYWERMGDTRTEHIARLTKAEWNQARFEAWERDFDRETEEIIERNCAPQSFPNSGFDCETADAIYQSRQELKEARLAAMRGSP